MPLSRTEISTSGPSRRTFKSMRPPGGVYLAELIKRLPTICVRRTLSPWTTSGSCGSDTWSVWHDESISGRL